MNKRIDNGEFENERIITAHPYKKGHMVFTEKAIYYVEEKKKSKVKKKSKK
jgi:hypothetical protein